jgi:hypothetical protein
MINLLPPSFYGWILIFTIFTYTIFLIRSGRLSAHLAISWIIAEFVFMGIMYFDSFRAHLKSNIGEDRAAYSLLLVGAIWFIFLMLEILTRISALTIKLKIVNQELALLKERFDRVDPTSNLDPSDLKKITKNSILN